MSKPDKNLHAVALARMRKPRDPEQMRRAAAARHGVDPDQPRCGCGFVKEGVPGTCPLTYVRASKRHPARAVVLLPMTERNGLPIFDVPGDFPEVTPEMVKELSEDSMADCSVCECPER